MPENTDDLEKYLEEHAEEMETYEEGSTELLRELFYWKTEFGNQLSFLIRGWNPDLWQRIETHLNPEKKEGV